MHYRQLYIDRASSVLTVRDRRVTRYTLVLACLLVSDIHFTKETLPDFPEISK